MEKTLDCFEYIQLNEMLFNKQCLNNNKPDPQTLKNIIKNFIENSTSNLQPALNEEDDIYEEIK